ncbi:hypothetical protein FPZ12_020180 [Amycolatopsis acidicola]|uniref:Nuclear transport factor 2 family protein n=1 Tax=Amycolatopsis acidicola TaxID=2596893 RepID=A0A5N0V0Z7_9PSEU|nr:hypothetical protein [Amycolatopsis acidicola]KAA9159426.1 hypothetical protein FPZ12_020180 [Amycolatopsis acidicola]
MKNFGTGRWSRSIIVAAILLPPLAACSSGTGSDPAPSSQPNLSAPSQSTSPSVQNEQAAIEDAYTSFWTHALHTSDQPEDRWHDSMAEVAVDPQLTTTLNAMQQQKQSGVKVYGDVTARIASVQVTGASAKVTDCQDASRTGQADAKTGDPKTVGVERNPVSADLVRGTDGRWKVSQVTFPGGTC